MSNKKVWLVTGCSKGLGKALVEELIAQGYPVAGTSRSKESLEKSIGTESDIFLPLSMNVKEEADVTLSRTVDKFLTRKRMLKQSQQWSRRTVDVSPSEEAHRLMNKFDGCSNSS